MLHAIASPSRALAPSPHFGDLIARLPSESVVVAVTDDGSDARFDPVRHLAASIAVRVGGTVLFCVAPAGGQPTARARPRLFFPAMAPESGRPHTGTRRRDLLLGEARAVAAPGLTVGVWLPSRPGPAGVAEAVAATGAALVLVPARAHRPRALDRTLEYLAARLPIPVVAVDAGNSWSLVRPLGGKARDSAMPLAAATAR